MEFQIQVTGTITLWKEHAWHISYYFKEDTVERTVEKMKGDGIRTLTGNQIIWNFVIHCTAFGFYWRVFKGEGSSNSDCVENRLKGRVGS